MIIGSFKANQIFEPRSPVCVYMDGEWSTLKVFFLTQFCYVVRAVCERKKMIKDSCVQLKPCAFAILRIIFFQFDSF